MSKHRTGKAIAVAYTIIFTFILFLQLTINKEKTLSFLVFAPITLLVAFTVSVLIYKKKRFLEKHKKIIFITGISVMFAVILYCGMNLMQEYTDSNGVAHWDLGNILLSAETLATDGTLETEYFARYPNNLLLVILFSNIAKLVYAITGSVKLFYPVMVVLNSMVIISSITFIILSADKLRGTTGAMATMIACYGFLPFYLISAIPYSDTIALLCISAIVFLIIRFFSTKKLWLIAVAGFIGGFGASIKITVAIPIIALFLVILLSEKGLKNKLKYDAILVGIFALIYCILSLAVNNCGLISDEDRNEYQFPITHWIMMSLEGEGTYSQEDVEFTKNAGDMEAKKTATIKEIKNRIANRTLAENLYHIFVVKNYSTWCSGSQGLLWSMDFNYPRSWITKLIKDNTTIYNGVAAYAYGFFTAFTTLALAGTILNIKRGKRPLNVLRLTLIGVFLFFLIWEAKTAYIFQFMPIIFLLAIDAIFVFLHSAKRKKSKQN